MISSKLTQKINVNVVLLSFMVFVKLLSFIDANKNKLGKWRPGNSSLTPLAVHIPAKDVRFELRSLVNCVRNRHRTSFRNFKVGWED